MGCVTSSRSQSGPELSRPLAPAQQSAAKGSGGTSSAAAPYSNGGEEHASRPTNAQPQTLPSGLSYETFAELAVAHLQGLATKQAGYQEGKTRRLSTHLANASNMRMRNSFIEHGSDNVRQWRRTAKLLDRDKRGWVEWSDVEAAVRELGQEREQAALVMDMLQTITRSKVRLRHIFLALDKDGGGTLCREEWEDGLLLLLGGGEEMSQSDRDKLWEVLDVDGDGDISYQEFLEGLSVEDTWGLHPNHNEALAEEELRRKLKKELRIQATAPQQGAHRMIDVATDVCPGVDPSQDTPRMRAGRVIARFLRRAKAFKMFESSVWLHTVRMLDVQDELELNTSDGGSTRGEDSDSDEEEKPTEVSAAVQELESVAKELFQRRLPPLLVAKAIIQAVTLLHQESPNVGVIKPPSEKSTGGRVVIVGDLHGQLEDLLLIFDRCGRPSEASPTIFLFNGDFVDRGPYGVEVLLLLYTLKLLWPAKVFMNRGNHEARRINEKYGFDEEVQSKYNHSIFKLMTKSFNALPLCHIVFGSIFVMHGGLSDEQDVSVADYNMINRFKQIPRKDEIPHGPHGRYDRLFEAAMWSDPRELDHGRATEPSKRGAGCHFGRPAVEAFLQKNGLRRFIRSHEVYQPGYQDHHDRLTTTVFSASNYCSTDDNYGCYLVATQPPDWEAPPQIQYMQYRVVKDQMLELQGGIRSAVDQGDEDKAAEVRQVASNAKEECLRRLRGIIFCRRTELMQHFQVQDTQRCGKIHIDLWVEAMRTFCSPGLPWRCMQRHLVPMEDDGLIPYVTFLERFQNRLARRWMEQWGKKMMRHMADRMLFATQTISEAAGSETAERSPSLSYYQMCEALRGVLPGLSEAAIYYLMNLCDTNKDGFIDVDEFTAAVEAAREGDEESAPGVLDLWDLATFDPPGFSRLQRSFLLTIPSEQARLIAQMRSW
eukprot:TRINITY_DN1221_c0_g1_i1.p1 TRINITY_DN1221_c0_g1~~TRINITY_DN1221_c0_g1_i1.p1  ORF type:complete len:938 (+),score=345.20 TRINITY_DN1221_c0_g1_i1:135-2948(+)